MISFEKKVCYQKVSKQLVYYSMQISKHQVVHLKYVLFIYINDILIRLFKNEYATKGNTDLFESDLSSRFLGVK